MKFLVLALCVCAASAASFGSNSFGAGGYKAYKGFQNTVVAPVTTRSVAAAAASVVAPVTTRSVAAAAAPDVAPVTTRTVAAATAPVVVAPVAAAAAATYNAGSAVYQGAKQVVNKDEGGAAILRSESDVGVDSFRYAFETGNGISGDAVGTYKQVGDSGSIVSQGSYRYTAPDGTPVQVVYTADENGYQPQSDILPVGPETPPAILRALEYIAAKSKETVQKY